MEFKFVTLTPDNLASEHLSCIIRTKKAHPGVEAKRRWLAERLPEGHISISTASGLPAASREKGLARL